jgi:hypothetical protein
MHVVSELITQWRISRDELVALERAEHPDIIDRFGRVWTWKSRDLYRHCGNAAPAYMINDFGLPAQAALDNPNYDLCAVCVDGRTRNLPACRPEWGCTHPVHVRSAQA